MVLDRYFLSQIIKRESHLGEKLIVYAKSYTTVIALLCSKAHCLDHDLLKVGKFQFSACWHSSIEQNILS